MYEALMDVAPWIGASVAASCTCGGVAVRFKEGGMHPRNGLIVVVAVIAAVVSTARAGEKADTLPEGVIGYLATTRAEYLDGELLKVFQSLSGAGYPLNCRKLSSSPVFRLLANAFDDFPVRNWCHPHGILQ